MSSELVEAVTATLIVLARHQRLEAIEATLGIGVGAGDGAAARLTLPWRMPTGGVARRVARLLDGRSATGRLELGVGDWVVGASPNSPIALAGPDSELIASRIAVLRASLSEQGDVPAGRLELFSPADDWIIAHAQRAQPTWTAGSILTPLSGHVRHSPDAVAIADGSRSLRYGQLPAATARLAARLAEAGVRAGDVVAVAVPRQVELIISYLALWSLGAAFLPVDLTHPAERVRHQMTAAGARRIVVAPGTDSSMTEYPTVPVELAAGPDTECPAGSGAALDWERDPGELAYVMCTSGSTGKPKAVEIPHGALHNCVRAFAGLLGASGPTVAGLTSPIFDISLLEFFLPLATGGQLLLVDRNTQRDPALLANWLRRTRPDVVQATPTTWRMVIPYLSDELHETTVLCGGEAVSADLAKELVARAGRVWNVYGPTEATIWCTADQVRDPSDPVPIGRPVAGTTAVVLDSAGARTPVGQRGELYVGGCQVALGYRDDAERTAAAFIEHPEFGRLYRTGDRCSWRADGRLEFHGRVDNQIKLRGHRIELEEIESAAERDPAVARAAAVVAEPSPGDQRLVLYVQPGPGAVVVTADLRIVLAGWLPASVVPQQIVVLEAFPQTANNKIDRQALKRHALHAHLGT